MRFFIYRRASSDSARALTNALQGVRCVGENGAPRKLAQAGANDIVVFWGDLHTGQLPVGIKTLNRVAVGNKITDAEKLIEKGVPTITISRTRPVPNAPVDDGFLQLAQEVRDAAYDFAEIDPVRGAGPYLQGITDLHGLLARYRDLVAVPQPAAVWLPRVKNHVGGNDLLAPEVRQPDYWVKKEDITREVRVHSFKGKSIRAGVKIPREEFGRPHEWIRSWDAGWKISYDGNTVRQKHRDIAHKAIEALGLDFGAVDVAERPDGSVFVLEVNRAPGIEAGTIDAYARAIRGWAAEGV